MLPAGEAVVMVPVSEKAPTVRAVNPGSAFIMVKDTLRPEPDPVVVVAIFFCDTVPDAPLPVFVHSGFEVT